MVGFILVQNLSEIMYDIIVDFIYEKFWYVFACDRWSGVP